MSTTTTSTLPAQRTAFARGPKRIAPESSILVALSMGGGALKIMSDWDADIPDISIDEAVPLAETLLEVSNQRRTSDMAPVIAVAQLCKSDRGRKATLAFHQMLEGGGAGLDSNNWRALEALCRFAYTEDRGAYLLFDILPTSPRKGGAK